MHNNNNCFGLKCVIWDCVWCLCTSPPQHENHVYAWYFLTIWLYIMMTRQFVGPIDVFLVASIRFGFWNSNRFKPKNHITNGEKMQNPLRIIYKMIECFLEARRRFYFDWRALLNFLNIWETFRCQRGSFENIRLPWVEIKVVLKALGSFKTLF